MTKRKLHWTDAKDSDSLAGDPGTWEGRVKIVRQVCSSLTQEEAEEAADALGNSGTPCSRDAIRSFLSDIYER